MNIELLNFRLTTKVICKLKSVKQFIFYFNLD